MSFGGLARGRVTRTGTISHRGTKDVRRGVGKFTPDLGPGSTQGPKGTLDPRPSLTGCVGGPSLTGCVGGVAGLIGSDRGWRTREVRKETGT